MASADAEVEEAAGVADGDGAVVVDEVVADTPGVAGLCECGAVFGGGMVGGVWGAPVECSVGSLGVVDGLKDGELCVELGQGGGGWLGVEPAFEGLVEALNLALGGGMVGAAVLLSDVQIGGQVPCSGVAVFSSRLGF